MATILWGILNLKLVHEPDSAQQRILSVSSYFHKLIKKQIQAEPVPILINCLYKKFNLFKNVL